MADRGGFRRQEVIITYAYLLLHLALARGQISFNMWVLSSKAINFPYPLGLTLLPMVFSSLLCLLLAEVFKVMKVEEGMTIYYLRHPQRCNVCHDSLVGKYRLPLNLCRVFTDVEGNNALTNRVAGVVKDWVVVLVSALLFANIKPTTINLMGYGIGVAAYNNHKPKKEASLSGQTNEQQPQSIQ